MIGTVSVFRNGLYQCVDADKVRPDEIACCPVCKVRGITKYDPLTESVIFAAPKHKDSICQAMAKTKSIKRIRNVSGTELIENLFASNPIKSRSKVLTLADVHSIGLHNASPNAKIRDGILSDYLLTNNNSLSELREQRTIGKRIIRAKLDFFDVKTNSIISICNRYKDHEIPVLSSLYDSKRKELEETLVRTHVKILKKQS